MGDTETLFAVTLSHLGFRGCSISGYNVTASNLTDSDVWLERLGRGGATTFGSNCGPIQFEYGPYQLR